MNDKLGLFFYTMVIHSDEGIKIFYWLSCMFIIITNTNILNISLNMGTVNFTALLLQKAVECNHMLYFFI